MANITKKHRILIDRKVGQIQQREVRKIDESQANFSYALLIIAVAALVYLFQGYLEYGGISKHGWE